MAVICCPDCGREMKGLGALFTCHDCDVKYEISFTCRDCGAVPEEMNACGSTGYFCNSCKALRSRTSMNKEFRRIGSASG